MNAPARIDLSTGPAAIEFARALARAHVARDIAAARQGDDSRNAHADLRPLL